MIFVTGGTGIVGAHLLYDLALKGIKVRALKRKESSLQLTEKIFSFYSRDHQLLLNTIEWVDGDILDKDGLRELLIGVDQIYHVAAIMSFDPRKGKEIIHTNCEGTANLVELAIELGIHRFCHVSSIAAVGSPPEGIEATEDHPWRNSRDHSAYSESKYLSEMEVWRGILQGLDAVIVNPSVIVAPGDWKSGSSILFSKVWHGMKFYTKGGTGFVDVRDVTSAMQRLMADDFWETVKNQRYILNAKNIPFREFFNQVADSLRVKRPNIFAGKISLQLAWRLSVLYRFLTGIKPSITKDTARSAAKLSWYDGSKICRAIGFKYTPIEISISDVSSLYLKDINRI